MTVKRDEEEELMMTIYNQVLVNTPVHKEPLSQARYTAPRTFGYGAQVKKLERHVDQFQQMMAPFHAASAGRVQNRHPADVEDKTQGTPLEKEETSSCHIVLVKEQQPDSPTKPDVKPKEMAVATPASIQAVIEPTLQELPVPRALQAFFWWVNVMMRYIPEGTQIWAVNAAKSTICDMLSETMVNTAVPPGMEAGFAQLVMAAAAPPPEGKDKCMVQFMDESEGGGEPQATAVQLSRERTPHQSGELHRTRSRDSDSHTCQEALNQVREDANKGKPKPKSVVKKPDQPATPALSPINSTSPKRGTGTRGPRRND